MLLFASVAEGVITEAEVRKEFGEDVALIVHGLNRIRQLYDKNPSVQSENFRGLLLSFASDMRVILIMLASRICLMRQIKESENEEARQKVSMEAAYLLSLIHI